MKKLYDPNPGGSRQKSHRLARWGLNSLPEGAGYRKKLLQNMLIGWLVNVANWLKFLLQELKQNKCLKFSCVLNLFIYITTFINKITKQIF
jgi:hypothetical protein